MTREEVIWCLSVHSSTNGSGLCTDEQHYEAKQLAIKALEQEPCEDAISREATLKPYNGLNDEDTISVWLIRKNIEQQPPVNPQPKTGHWEWVQYDYNPKIGNWHCSECRSVVVECVSKDEKSGIPSYKYCPQCGAKMSEIPTGSDDELYSDCIDAFKEYALGRKEQ